MNAIARLFRPILEGRAARHPRVPRSIEQVLAEQLEAEMKIRPAFRGSPQLHRPLRTRAQAEAEIELARRAEAARGTITVCVEGEGCSTWNGPMPWQGDA